jgi:general L-amino acid transport system permease protein
VIAVFAGYIGGVFINNTFSPRERPRQASTRIATWMLIVAPILMFVFVYGLGNILPLSDTARWGGLLLTLMLTVVGIIASFPIGVLLALGRRSSLPVISTFCTLYIEFVRGVPLITVLFMAQLLVPLVNPSLASTPGAFRAMIAVLLFSAAYLAENTRGGLQSIPPGQEEAAKALGLSGWQATLYITLPQALRAVIPAMVGSFISLYKDTSLVAIVGLLDLLGMSKNVVAQTEFLQRQREVLLFIVIIYFLVSYSMSTLSKRIESSGAGKAMAKKI